MLPTTVPAENTEVTKPEAIEEEEEVEATTVVNYEKEELVELLEERRLRPGLVLVNFKPGFATLRDAAAATNGAATATNGTGEQGEGEEPASKRAKLAADSS